MSWVRTMTFRVGSHETETCSKEPNEKPWGRAKKEVLGKTMTFQVRSHATEKCSKDSNVKPYKEGGFQNFRSGTGAPFRREPLRGCFGWCLRPIEKHGAATRHILARPEKVES